jgi:hypothetical protein
MSITATTQTAEDPFTAILGRTRGAQRPAREDPEVISAARRRRYVLARIAAHGILDHNTAVSMPNSFSAGKIAALVEHGGRPDLLSESSVSDELLEDLRALTRAGLLREWKDSWGVTPNGLVELWTDSLQHA